MADYRYTAFDPSHGPYVETWRPQEADPLVVCPGRRCNGTSILLPFRAHDPATGEPTARLICWCCRNCGYCIEPDKLARLVQRELTVRGDVLSVWTEETKRGTRGRSGGERGRKKRVHWCPAEAAELAPGSIPRHEDVARELADTPRPRAPGPTLALDQVKDTTTCLPPVRIGRQEASELRQLAAARGESVSEFVRRACRQALQSND